jgi:exosortase
LRRPVLAERGMLAAILRAVGVVGWPSISGLLALADGDTPVSFVSLVGLIGVAGLLYSADGVQLRARDRDAFLDGLALVVLLGATTVVLYVLPATMSWDYWLASLDIPGLILLFATLVVAAWGLPGLQQLGRPLLYLLLTWPLPYLVLYRHVMPSLTDATALAVRVLVSLFPWPIHADPSGSSDLLITFHHQTTQLVIAQACAGINGAVGLAVIALPVGVLSRGSAKALGAWLILGVLLSWLSNVVRILLIAVAAAVAGPDAAMTLLHPVLGLVLFGLSFALLLGIAPICGLDVTVLWHKGTEGSPSAGMGATAGMTAPWSSRRLLLVGLILSVGALMENDLNQSRWVSEATLPRVGLVRPADLFPTPAGWRLMDVTPMDSWRSLFGPSTVAAVMDVMSPSQTHIGVQAILTRDAGTFTTYGVENCYIFHGYTLQGVHRVALGNGVIGTVVDFRDSARAAALYWLQPVQTPQGLFHERIELIADAAPQAARLQTPAQGSSLQRAAIAMLDLLSPWSSDRSADPAYQGMNAQLQDLGQAVVAQERRPR